MNYNFFGSGYKVKLPDLPEHVYKRGYSKKMSKIINKQERSFIFSLLNHNHVHHEEFKHTFHRLVDDEQE
jgi:hypothetical protein